MNRQALPLEGIRVIDYSHFLAGPHMSRCLSAMGAEVIKVERPTSGDAGRASPTRVNGQSGYFLQQNMGKRGLCINLKDARGLEMMHKLADTADVFVENYRPGALDKLGLGYAELSERNPKLVYCSVSAYGHTGPDAARPGFGLIAEAKIVPPTSQNQGQIEADLRALVPQVVSLDDAEATHRCEHMIRNYDPCISCATHFLNLTIDRGPAG